jgi:hypothetical protein
MPSGIEPLLSTGNDEAFPTFLNRAMHEKTRPTE